MLSFCFLSMVLLGPSCHSFNVMSMFADVLPPHCACARTHFPTWTRAVFRPLATWTGTSHQDDQYIHLCFFHILRNKKKMRLLYPKTMKFGFWGNSMSKWTGTRRSRNAAVLACGIWIWFCWKLHSGFSAPPAPVSGGYDIIRIFWGKGGRVFIFFACLFVLAILRACEELVKS